VGDILERIARKSGVPDLVDRLVSRLSGSDVQSLLLEVSRRRTQQRTPGELLSDYQRNRFTRPGKLDPRIQHRLDQIAFALLPAGFEPIELSPVAPVGASAVVTPLDPRLAIATVRNTEVVSDNTNALALEAALRRKRLLRDDPRSSTQVKLAASHRLVRPQRYGSSGMDSHFRMFALVVAGRDTGSKRFEVETFPDAVGFFVRLLRDGVGRAPETIRVSLTPLDDDHRALVVDGIRPVLENAHPGTPIELDEKRVRGRGYYCGVCFNVYARDDDGREIELADGGCTDWTAQLLSNRKERLLTAGIGSERVAAAFGFDLREGRNPDGKG